MSLIKKRWIYLVSCILIFYLFPFFDWRGEVGGEIVLVLFVLPCATLVLSIIYGVKNGFDLILPIFVGIVFLSTLFIFYNYSAWGYIFAYMVISVIGICIGNLFNKKEN